MAFYCDESGFPLTACTGELAPVGCKFANYVSCGNKQQITTLACFNAAGEITAPYHVFPGERIKQNLSKDAVHNAYLGRSDNGWMTTNLLWLAG